MVTKLFWSDPYLSEIETVVTAVHGNEVTLRESIFYALSGGQESDRGSIGGHRVRQARKDGMEVRYSLDEGHGLAPGEDVTVRIDWTRRYRLMRLHFATEVLLELVTRHFPQVRKTGAHIAEDKARIDFEWEGNISAIFPVILPEARALIDADQEITSAFSDAASQRRYWRVAGFAEVPCGGTHLRRTGEVGEIRLKRRNPGRGRERIEVYLAETDTEGRR